MTMLLVRVLVLLQFLDVVVAVVIVLVLVVLVLVAVVVVAGGVGSDVFERRKGDDDAVDERLDFPCSFFFRLGSTR